MYIGISLLVLGITMTFTSFYVVEERVKVINQLSQHIEKQASSAAAIFVDREQQNKLELEYFSELALIWQSLSAQHYQALDDIFIKLMQKKSSIVQIRLLNLAGKELYRIDDKANTPTRVPDSALQNKANRYYIQELIDTPIDKTYLSKIDLNIEHGVIEQPYRPVLRIAKKIVNQETNQALGALVFNFDLNRLFANVSASIPEQMEWYFIDGSGQFLANPKSDSLYCTQIDCDIFHDRMQYHPGVRNYYQQHLASVVNIMSDAGIKGSHFQLLVSYKPNFMPLFTKEKNNISVLLSSALWWTILCISIAILMSICLLYERYQQQITDKINREKMQSVLEGVTEMLERLHENDDAVTGSHVHRVAAYSRLMAEHLGLDKRLVQDIYQFSSLHDIGKISTPDNILGKPGKLEADEWRVMKQHVDNGYQLLHEFDLSIVAENIVLSHHERWDGKGYPKQIAGDAIPIEARIVSLVDCFDALMSERPYKPAFSFEKSKSIINELKGKAFDPQLVVLFNHLEDEFKSMINATKANHQ